MAPTYESVALRSTRTGQTPAEIRKDIAAGRIPGALRLGSSRSPWALPAPDLALVPNALTPTTATTQTRDGGGTVITATEVRGQWVDLMSTSDTDPVGLARRVADRVATAHTRPANALADLAFRIASLAAAHTIDRDGMCAKCGWRYPCPDREGMTAALLASDSITATGVLA